MTQINHGDARKRIAGQDEKAVLAAKHVEMLAGLVVSQLCDTRGRPEVDRRLPALFSESSEIKRISPLGST